MKRVKTYLPFLAVSLLLSSCSCLKKKGEEAVPAPTEQAQPGEQAVAQKVVAIADVAQFERELANSKKLVAKFHANWCPHCKAMAGHYEDLANKFGEIKFVVIDVDALKDLTQKYEVGGFPTFIVFEDGKKGEVVIGANTAKLDEVVEKLAKSTAQEPEKAA